MQVERDSNDSAEVASPPTSASMRGDVVVSGGDGAVVSGGDGAVVGGKALAAMHAYAAPPGSTGSCRAGKSTSLKMSSEPTAVTRKPSAVTLLAAEPSGPCHAGGGFETWEDRSHLGSGQTFRSLSSPLSRSTRRLTPRTLLLLHTTSHVAVRRRQAVTVRPMQRFSACSGHAQISRAGLRATCGRQGAKVVEKMAYSQASSMSHHSMLSLPITRFPYE